MSSVNKSHRVIDALYDIVSNISRDKRITTEIKLESRLFLSALISESSKSSYKEYRLPNTEEDVRSYWLDEKYDEIEDTRILHHYKSAISLVYDNGIRSLDYNGEATHEEDVEDILYIKVDSVPVLERQFNTVTKETTHITPHIDAITAKVYDVISNGTYEFISSRVLGYKITDTDTVLSPLKSDWKSHQLLGNLLEFEDKV